MRARKLLSIPGFARAQKLLKVELKQHSHYGAFTPPLDVHLMPSLGFRKHVKSRSAFFAPGSAASQRSPPRKDPHPPASDHYWPVDKSADAWIFRSFNGKIPPKLSRHRRYRSCAISPDSAIRLEDSCSLRSLVIRSKEIPRRQCSKSQVSVTTQYDDSETSFRLLLRKPSGDLPLQGWT